MLKSAVYLNNSFIGEVDVNYTTSWMKEIRISHFSQSSERCFPLAILHSISKDGICFKLESKIPTVELLACYSTCLRENKTAVVALGDEELHLVALPPRNNLMQCLFFWGFRVSRGLYNSSMVMLNLRCLSIVFDLDETLIVANTMRSFEDKINILQQKISMETDPHRIALMIAEVKRYQEDKHMLKQYVENDQVLDDGVVYKAQLEVVQPVTGSHQPLSRPIIRLQEKNIILTRVNPEIRDTSILVRLRPAWEDLRSYLTARGRKRFEVFVCTMAEREYALEMWRLLDPQSQLISYEEISDRIVCVKFGMKKSLLDVFQGGICDPKMGLVIDDRLNVWDENDKLRVHVVPAFAPYYAPLAEEDNMIPILRVARNVVCNVRGKFFKEFDENLLPRFANICYEDEIIDLPYAPDVSNYLVTEGNACSLNVSKDPVGLEGISDSEAERRMKDARYVTQSYPPITNGSGYDLMSTTSSALSVITSLRRVIKPVSSPVIEEEGEVHEMELDPDTRRRLLILQHGQDDSSSSPPPPPPAAFPFRSPPIQIPVTSSQPHENWLPLEDGMMPPWQAKKLRKEFALKPEKYFDRKLTNSMSFVRGNDYDRDRGCDRFDYENHKLPPEAHYGEYQKRRKRPMSSCISYSGEEKPITNFPSSRRDDHFKSRHPVARYRDDKLEVLQNIARDAGGGKLWNMLSQMLPLEVESSAVGVALNELFEGLGCSVSGTLFNNFQTLFGVLVEFTTDVCDTIELQFIVEAWFVGDKVGEGIGRTRKEAQLNAAMEALDTLTNTYIAPNTTSKQKKRRKPSHSHENNTSDPVAVKQAIKESTPSVTTLKELCITKGYTLHFLVKSSTSAGSDDEERAQYCAQVEIAGQIMGSGTGKTWEEAKTQAAEEALDSLQSLQGQFA